MDKMANFMLYKFYHHHRHNKKMCRMVPGREPVPHRY